MSTVPERDAFEIALVRAAIARELPVLGICRGMQLINVACGGTLFQHLPERFGHHEHLPVAGSFDDADHDVLLQEARWWPGWWAETGHATKSHHHQGVDRLGEGLRGERHLHLDGLPEAIELDGDGSSGNLAPLRARRAVASGGRCDEPDRRRAGGGGAGRGADVVHAALSNG